MVQIACTCVDDAEKEDDCGCGPTLTDTRAPIVTAEGAGDASMDKLHITWRLEPDTQKDLETIYIRYSKADDITAWNAGGVSSLRTVTEVAGRQGVETIDVTLTDDEPTDYYWAVFGKDKDGNISTLSDDAKGVATVPSGS